MSGTDWDGNMVHMNFNNKTAVAKPRAAAKAKATAFFDSSDEDTDFVVMLPTKKKD